MSLLANCATHIVFHCWARDALPGIVVIRIFCCWYLCERIPSAYYWCVQCRFSSRVKHIHQTHIAIRTIMYIGTIILTGLQVQERPTKKSGTVSSIVSIQTPRMNHSRINILPVLTFMTQAFHSSAPQNLAKKYSPAKVWNRARILLTPYFNPTLIGRQREYIFFIRIGCSSF